ncbi:hypothetical protein [Chondromyces apiculatus]|uniref:Lipoprotein n=1 Tax=Chondromyces apiculatus DSM 436 TaxID=1192034 RepID=A0A017T283_9BACT|nr:hypothetical protein [Chondromyces apiculatus]EYF02955.1 Hypothetical protein CAP_6378 [Chondromyces apiculatus DSM 436]
MALLPSRRSFLSFALMAPALAVTGCEPIMEVYMSTDGSIGVSSFTRFDEIHCIIYLRGGDTNSRLNFKLSGGAAPPGENEVKLIILERNIFPRPSTAQLGDTVTVDVQLLGPALDPTKPSVPSTGGPWVPDNYSITVILDDASTGQVIQEETVDFSIR